MRVVNEEIALGSGPHECGVQTQRRVIGCYEQSVNRQPPRRSNWIRIECQSARHYSGPVTSRILLTILLAWTAIAPAIANSCAAGCQIGAASERHLADERSEASGVPDCHGAGNQHEDTEIPDGGSMAVACFVASAASIPCFFSTVATIDIASEHHVLVLLPPLSFETSAPTKPPQA